ncbi:MAG TPA: hypothetical protein VK034_02220 [Enhygromyxa sp.]|nr:hypothetical protein [Enhygromyxa sp.]
MIIATILIATVAGLNTYHVATNRGWLWAAIFGAALPIAALAEWAFLRRRGEEARRVADRMLIIVLWALIGLGDAAGAF